MVATQGSDKDVRAGTRLNKQLTDFETSAFKSEEGCESEACLLRREKKCTHKPGQRDGKKGNQGHLFM